VRPDQPDVQPLDLPPGNSREQQEAEAFMLRALSERLGVDLQPQRIPLPEGGWLTVDGASPALDVLCEAWAHQGRAKPAQKNKLLADALKLTLAARIVGGTPRLYLLVSDEEAAVHLRGRAWAGAALRHHGIQLEVVDLPADVRERVRAAQARQFR
jgi:hypothetical protein